jgi:aspartate aminotransferase-like enzyme
MAGKVWRIGLMGDASSRRNVLLFLGALERCLATQGVKVAPGAGVGAAVAAYGK